MRKCAFLSCGSPLISDLNRSINGEALVVQVLQETAREWGTEKTFHSILI